MPALETYEEKRTYKIGRLRQLLGLNGSTLSPDNEDSLGQLADLCANSADPESLDQPLAFLGVGRIPQAREIARALPATPAIEHWLHFVEQAENGGPIRYHGV